MLGKKFILGLSLIMLISVGVLVYGKQHIANNKQQKVEHNTADSKYSHSALSFNLIFVILSKFTDNKRFEE